MASVADEAAFNAFVAARTAALIRTAFLLTRDRQLAEDLVQTALFKAAQRWEHIKGEPEPYVRRILYTENVSWWRRRRRIVETATPQVVESVGHADVDLQLSVESALDRLTVKQRTVLVLRYYEDLTEAEAAAGARSVGRDREVDPPAGSGAVADPGAGPRCADRSRA